MKPVGAKGVLWSQDGRGAQRSSLSRVAISTPANPTGNLEWLYMKNALRQTFKKINKGNNKKMLESLKGDGK